MLQVRKNESSLCSRAPRGNNGCKNGFVESNASFYSIKLRALLPSAVTVSLHYLSTCLR